MGLMMSELPWSSPHRQHPDGSPSRWRQTNGITWAPRDIGTPRDFSDTVPTEPAPLSCSGEGCQQGRRECPHREACQLPEMTAAGRFWTVYLVGVVLACLLAVHFIVGAA